MGRKIDTDDLIDAEAAAAILGITSVNAVSAYRGRYPDFPTPVWRKGKCVLWVREDMEAWARGPLRPPTRQRRLPPD